MTGEQSTDDTDRGKKEYECDNCGASTYQHGPCHECGAEPFEKSTYTIDAETDQ